MWLPIEPNGTVTIAGNAPGCTNPTEIADACGFTLDCLPYGNYIFLTQSEINNFQNNYPECSQLEGDILIRGENNIADLSGLDVVTSCTGGLSIKWNYSITNLTGLDNLASIGGNLEIYNNDILNDLTGFDNLASIGGNLRFTVMICLLT